MVQPVNLTLSTTGTTRAYAPTGEVWKLTEGGISTDDVYNSGYLVTLGTTDGSTDGGGFHSYGSLTNDNSIDSQAQGGGAAWVTDSQGIALNNYNDNGTVNASLTGVRVE